MKKFNKEKKLPYIPCWNAGNDPNEEDSLK